jgi:hypothetical protein
MLLSESTRNDEHVGVRVRIFIFKGTLSSEMNDFCFHFVMNENIYLIMFQTLRCLSPEDNNTECKIICHKCSKV